MRGRLLRLGITAVACLWIVHLVDLRQLAAAVRQTNRWGLGAACLLYLLALLACCVRWYLLLAPTHPQPFRQVLRWFLIGAFFNTLLPTTIGGDVVRIQKAGHAIGSWSQAAATVLLDRVSGFVAMFSIGATATLIALPRIHDPVILQGVLGLAGLFTLLLGCLVSPRLLRWMIAPLGWLRLHRLHAAVQEFQTLLHAYGRHPRALGLALGCSFIAQGAGMWLYWVVARAMGIPLPLWATFVFVPILMMIAVLPISLNGLGVREGAAIVLFGSLGIPNAEALGLSLVCAAIPGLSGLWGAVVFLRDRAHPPAAVRASAARATSRYRTARRWSPGVRRSPSPR